MKLQKEREQVVEYGIKLIETGLVTGTGGNISIYNPEENLIAISPSGMDYFELTPEDVSVINLEGELIDGPRKPSSEVDLHRIFYNRRDDITAVVHTHSTYCTILASLQWELPAVNYYIGLVGGPNVRCGEYKAFGTPEVAETTFEAMKDRKAALIANHGMIAGGNSIGNAFSIAEETERMAETYYKAKLLGDPYILNEDEVQEMVERFPSYGQ
jgi:L-fuculose-phosphate aldolase